MGSRAGLAGCAAPGPAHLRTDACEQLAERFAQTRHVEAPARVATKCALRLAPLVFVRPGELRKAQWSEIDLDKAEWRIPAERMKMRAQHLVPLSRQAVTILGELEPLTNRPILTQPEAPRYVFPGARTRLRPMSENAILAALCRMGYTKEEMTGHGFRSMASTLLHELGWNHHVIERQLTHAERDVVSAAYNFAEHLPERRKMMQAWADYLDGLKVSADVTPIFKEATNGRSISRG